MATELSILMVEDREEDTFLIQRELRRHGLTFRTRRVCNEPDLRRALKQAQPDIVLSDFCMPGFGGTIALSVVREQLPQVPFIFVSGTIGEEQAVDLLKEGATDFVLKDRLMRLAPSINRALREVGLEQERRRAEENYRGIFDNAVLGIYQLAPDGRLLATNSALARQFGYSSPADMVARVSNARALFVDSGRADAFAAAMEENGEIYNFESEMQRPDGSRFWVSQHARRVSTSGAADAHYEGFAEDITRHREMEAQVLRAQRMESIGTLAGGVAHDLNNIISPILMAVSMLQSGAAPEQRAKFLTLIETSARRGAQIVKQVLTFGRGVEGERRPLGLGDVFGEILKIVEETFPKNVVVESYVQPGLRLVNGDTTQLQQVVLNLAVNARDAMPSGGRLRLQASNCDISAAGRRNLSELKPGPHVLIEVSDTGTGIAPDVAERIFDPFFTTKEVGQGTGLGLSTVRGIVKSHGGCVSVVSEPGHGAIFQVYLPSAPEKRAPIELIATPRTVAGNDHVLLLVDDEESIRVAVGTMLSMRGFRVLTARDGQDALRVYRENAKHIDLVLTDVTMPTMDGVALIQALRQMRSDLPVIASSGKGEKAVLAQLKSIRTNAILDKPYAADRLFGTINDVLSEHSAADAATTLEPAAAVA